MPKLVEAINIETCAKRKDMSSDGDAHPKRKFTSWYQMTTLGYFEEPN